MNAAPVSAAMAAQSAGAPAAAQTPSPLASKGLVPRVAFRALLADGEPAARALVADVALPKIAPHAVLPHRGDDHQVPQPRKRNADDEDPLDPMRRHEAALRSAEMAMHGVPLVAPPVAEPAPATAVARPLPSLEELLPTFVRRIAWSGDGKRGTARLEIGSGELAGATLLVHADADRVRVHLDVPAGVDAGEWQARIRRRLESRQIVADAVEVT